MEGKEETLILDIGINTNSQLEQLSNRRAIFLANMTFLFNGAIGLQVLLCRDRCQLQDRRQLPDGGNKWVGEWPGEISGRLTKWHVYRGAC